MLKVKTRVRHSSRNWIIYLNGNMKIAIIAPTYLPALRANTIQVMKMAQAMAVLGHKVRVAVPGAPQVSWDVISKHYGLQEKLSITWLPIKHNLRRYDYGIAGLKWAKAWQADLLYTRLPQAAAFGSLSGMPTVFEIHDLPHSITGKLLLRLFRKGKGSRKIVVISRSLADDLICELPSLADSAQLLVAPDGVDLVRYRNILTIEQAREKLGQDYDFHLGQSRKVVGYTGHLYAGRGVAMMLEMAAALPEHTFLIVGGDPDNVTKIRDLVSTRVLKNVILTGFVPNAEVPVYQFACNTLMMPYQRHVAASSGGDIGRYLSPMKLFEYLACERPILSSDIPVLREVLDTEVALLLPPDDVKPWIKALQDIESNPEVYRIYGERARARAVDHTWEKRAEKILAGL